MAAPMGSGQLTPRGPRGLWAALVAASMPADEPEAFHGDAHLDFLARVSPPADVAPVIDLASYRSRR